MSPGDLDFQRDRQERLLREQERRLQELQQLPEATKYEVPPLPGKTPCFDIRRIELQGATLPADSAQEALLSPFIGRCLAADDLDALLRQITNWYLDRGYVTSRAYLPEQELNGGVLKIIVIEGRLERLIPGPESRLSPRELAMAFPGSEGEKLNLRELEQLLDQLNHLPSRRATLELLPGETPGDSRAVIASLPEKPWRLSLARHNDGQRSTGEQQWSLGLELDSPLGLSDQLTLGGGGNRHPARERAAGHASLAYSLPVGWWTFAYRHSQSHYRSLNEATGLAFGVSGKSRSHELRAERVLHRNGQGKTAMNLTLNQTLSRNYVEDSLLESSSPRLTEAALGLNHGRRIGTAFMNLDLGWQRGSSLLGGRADHPSEAGAPRAQYHKTTLTGSFWQPLSLLSPNLSFDSLFFLQKSEDVLYSARRLSIGGPGSVRGFKEGALSGDSGGYLRNQFRWRLPVPANAFGTGASGWLPAFAEEIGLTLAWDVGVIRRDRHNTLTGQHGRLSGRALELSIRGRQMRLHLSYSESLSRPVVLSRRERPVSFRLEFLL